ncbi:putative epidermal cell surface receptor [Apostichopus japonicus]|uniref:Putative epidermal cell surface receptor n=1 Tax=Stichopus japonicus TaxID=307972 RepID=A0A2G8LBA6_STIJA|nr:putative epidermal cell surface receptor [Apostichopus japonicus]
MIFFPCKVGNGTVASVRNLEPNTDYYFRISYRIPGEGGIMLEGPLSEVALHRTGMPAPSGGCEQDGQHFDEGHIVVQNCDSACECLLGSWICRPRGCPPGPDTMVNPINCKEVPHPDDPECCSVIRCVEGPNNPFNPASCQREGEEVHEHGDTYYYGCNELCYCDNGQEFCSSRCPDPGTMIPDESTCPSPVLNSPKEGECCPYWSCPAPVNSCEINGNTYEDGEYFDLGCSMRCQCLQSEVTCVPRCPPYEVPYLHNCANPRKVHIPGECCWQWECEEERDSCIIAGEHENITLAHGQEYDDGCETVCRCNHGLLECIPYCVEPSLPLPTPLCPHPVVTKLREGDCCKVIACHDLEEESPNVVRDVSLYAFNATSITVAFSPPQNPDLVSVSNGYIIHYTNRASGDNEVSQWEKLKQSFPSGVTIEGRIIIDIGNLQRDSTYYVQIQVSLPENIPIRWPHTTPNTDTIVVTTTEGQPQQCTFKSQVYMHDEEFSDGCAALCHCRSGRTVCRERCPSTLLIPSEQCKNPQLVVVKNECCPQWRCFPADGGCSHNDKNLREGWMEWRDSCDMRCSCRKGKVSCYNICSASPRDRPNCPYAVQTQVADTCVKNGSAIYSSFTDHPSIQSLSFPLSSLTLEIEAVNISTNNVTILWPKLSDKQRQYIQLLSLNIVTYHTAGTSGLLPEIPKYTLLNLKPDRSYVVMLVVLLGQDPTDSMIHLQSNKLEVHTSNLPDMITNSIQYVFSSFLKSCPQILQFQLFLVELEVSKVTRTSVTVHWQSLPLPLTKSIALWVLNVTNKESNELVWSGEIGGPALTFTINELKPDVYYIQLFGLADNGTLVLISKKVQVSLLQRGPHPGTMHRKAVRAVLGIFFFLVILLIPVVIYMYCKVKSRYHNQYNVYARSNTIKYNNDSTYEHIYEESTPQNLTEVTGGSEDNLLEPIRRDSEAGLLER